MKTENAISMEQLRKLLHISKRKASWMLQNGIIPCENRGCATHKFLIRLEDIEAYQRKTPLEQRRGIPTGLFNAKPSAIELHPDLYWKLRGKERNRFIAYLENVLIEIKDSLTVDETAAIIGYHRQTVHRHCANGDICAFLLYGKYIIPKSELIRYLAKDRAMRIQRKSAWHIEVLRKFE